MERTDERRHWADEPIGSVAEDSYGRAAFAAAVGKKIGELDVGAASTVFGLLGAWGSGKSSVAAMVAESLPPDWIVQEFTPWVASDPVALQLEFVAALDKALGGERAEEQAARARLQKFAEWAVPMLGVVPSVGSALGQTADRVIGKLTERAPWSAEFEAMSGSLIKLRRPLLIVCDDIDRLDAHELLEFLKVVRLLGRFPNVHYLVAYDAETVEDLLESQGVRGRSASFMEKIVQHPFELPELDYATRFDHVSRVLNQQITRDALQLNEQQVERLGKLVDALSQGLSTPRQIARFREHLAAITGLLSREVDFLDFAAVTYLRLNHREIYARLPKWAEQLRAGLPDGEPRKAEQHTLEEWQALLAEQSGPRSTRGAWEAIVFLFPHLRVWYQHTDHPQAYSDPHYTERYHSLGVPTNDVSDQLVESAVLALAHSEPDTKAACELAEIIDERHESVARLAIAKARQTRERVERVGDDMRAIVAFIAERMPPASSEDSNYRPSLSALYEWLGEEVVRAYGDGRLSVEQLTLLLGDERLRGLALRLSNSLSAERRGNPIQSLVDELASSYVAEIITRDNKVATIADLRDKLTVVDRSSTLGLGEVFGDLTQEPDLLLQLATTMVLRGRWYNGSSTREELRFDGELWAKISVLPLRAELLADFPSTPRLDDLDRADTSEENIRTFAIAVLRHLNPVDGEHVETS